MISVFILKNLDLKKDTDKLNYEISHKFSEINLNDTITFLNNLKHNPELSDLLVNIH